MNNRSWKITKVIICFLSIVLVLSFTGFGGFGDDEAFTEDYQAALEQAKLERDAEVEEVIVVKEVVVESAASKLKYFNTTAKLDEWLATDDTNEVIFYFTDKDGKARLSDQYDCDDYAMQLQVRAGDDGYLMSVTIIPTAAGPHMINLATIEGGVYYIEPQTDGVEFYCNLD